MKLAPILSFMICVVIFHSMPMLSQAQTTDDAALLYNQAGILYQEGKFDDSLAIYESIIERGIENPDLYYNASNAAYRAGNIGLSLLYIERCLRLAPSDEDAIANKNFLNSIKIDQDSVSENALVTFIKQTYERMNVNTMAMMSAVTFAFSMLLATIAIFLCNSKKIAFLAIASMTLLICLVVSGLFLHKLNYLGSVNEAIVMNSEVRAYSGPGADNTHIFTIHEGTKVVIERSQGDWQLIRLSSGAGGWLQSESLTPIQTTAD